MANEPIPPHDTPPPLERRLATILSSDVAGYSRMMGEDEEATVQTFRGHRAVFEALLVQHHGRLFNTAGDAILAEFPSAVEAVRCATEIQSALQTRNAHLPPERQMLFRMGINLGDVVLENGDLLGDGVNVAARIQTIAEPGGICISGSVYDQIQNKLSLHFRSLGDQSFKNIRQPIRTFTITEGESGPLPVTRDPASGRSMRTLGAGALLAMALIAAGFWLYRDSESKRIEQAALATQLAAEKQAAAEARRAADEQAKRAAEAESKVDQERAAADALKREADLRGRTQATEEARRRNEAERKRLDDERQRLDAEAAASAAAAKADAHGARGARGAASTNRAAVPSSASGIAPRPPVKVVAKGSNKDDGIYDGQLCNVPADATKRNCWAVPLRVQDGVATGAWTRRSAGNEAHLQATIAQEGSVKATLDGWSAKDGSPLSGAMDGHVADNHIDVTGRWANGMRVEGHWTRTH